MTNVQNINDRALQDTPARALLLLRAISTKAEIRVVMQGAGFTEAENDLGWKLLLEAAGSTAGPLPVSTDEKARAAIAELDGWDESGFRRIHAALERLHPEQDQFVFAGLEPSRGPGAVVSVSTLLDRLDALERSPARALTRDADAKALATLAQRGIDPALRTHLRELVQSVQGNGARPPAPERATPEVRTQALQDLFLWFKDWSETARAVIHRRDYLVYMGISKRKGARTQPVAIS